MVILYKLFVSTWLELWLVAIYSRNLKKPNIDFYEQSDNDIPILEKFVCKELFSNFRKPVFSGSLFYDFHSSESKCLYIQTATS